MAEPKDYKHIRAWGNSLRSYEYYIFGEQTKAAEDNAPLNAIYYSDREERWYTADEIVAPETREEIEARVRAMEAK
jgi:hypothetical protein